MAAVVTTRQGKVEGRVEHRVHVFRGIPYARPPLGERRWRAPEPHPAWTATRPAYEFGPAAPQNSPTTKLISALVGTGAEQSEDCLYLNVWTPAPDNRRRPVLVWIHGGAFVLGAGSTGLYSGGRLAKRGDVVVVTINYRLGALGFLNLHALDDRLEANFGLRDQIAALAWVRDNIDQFGGDPDNVTIFGESAGGMSVGTLLGTPAARGLFHRAVAQSGAAHNVSDTALAARVAEELLRQLQAGRLDVGRLRKLPAEEILTAQAKASLKLGLPLGVLPWQPSLDGDVLPQQPLQSIGEGGARRVRLIVGTNSDEWRLFMLGDPKGRRLDEAGLRRRLARVLPGEDASGRPWSEIAFEAYAACGDTRRTWTPAERWMAFQADRVFHYPAHVLAETHASAGGAAYAYLFTWTPPLVGNWLGSFHGLEIPFVFGTVRDGPLRHTLARLRSVRDLSNALQQAWIAFAATGDPCHGALPAWPRYDAADRKTMLLDTRSTVRERPLEERRQLWSAILGGPRAGEDRKVSAREGEREDTTRRSGAQSR